jgi:hypothetical protein
MRLFVLACLAFVAPASAQVATGTYLGTGSARHLETPFAPVWVMVRGEPALPFNPMAVFRSATMTTPLSRPVSASGKSPMLAGGITSLDENGFAVGTAEEVNASGQRYFWVAMRQSEALRVGRWVGDDQLDRSITGLGIDPDFVLVLPESDGVPTFGLRSPSGQLNHAFHGNDPIVPTAFSALVADGFTLNPTDDGNRAGVTYHYVALKKASGLVALGSYNGDGAAMRAISTGLAPQWVLVQANTSNAVTTFGARPFSTELPVPDADPVADYVSLSGDGFSTHGTDRINDTALEFNYLALAGQSTLPDGGTVGALPPVPEVDAGQPPELPPPPSCRCDAGGALPLALLSVALRTARRRAARAARPTARP